MGHRQRPKANSKAKRRFYKRTILDLKNRTRDLDRIQDDLKALADGKVTTAELDYVANATDLPGNGQFHCVHCARHFVDARNLEIHLKTKDHKKQVKRCAEEQYTQAEADAGAGKGSGS
jgi:bud site selection protein 20